jgi:hypothetical protein
MKTGILAAILVATLAAPLLAVAVEAEPQLTESCPVSVHYTLTASIYADLAAGQVYWLNFTVLFQEDARVKVIGLGPFGSMPSPPPVFTLYIDDAKAFNSTATALFGRGLAVAAVPAANGTLKGGVQHRIAIKVTNGGTALPSTSSPYLSVLIERNVTASVTYNSTLAAVKVAVTPVQAGDVAASSYAHYDGAEDLFVIGTLVTYVASSDRVFAYQWSDGVVNIHSMSGFPPSSGFTVTVTVKPATLTALSWSYDGVRAADPGSYARILGGTRVSVSTAAQGALTVLDNGTQVPATWTPKAGKHTVAVVLVGSPRVAPDNWPTDAAVVGYNATYTSMTVETLKVVASYAAPAGYKPPFTIELAPGAAKDGIRYFNLLIKVTEGAVVVERAEAVRFDGAVLTGFASTVRATENLTTYQYLVNYTYALTRAEGAGLLKAVWGIESEPTVSSSTPVLHYVSTGKPFVVEADRPIVRVLDGTGNDVAFAGGAVAASKSDTYTVKLATYLKVVNTYEGKPVDALVTVRDARTGLILYQRRGGEVTFELEPQVSYLVESTTGAETLTARTTLPQDTTLTFAFTKPPAVPINWEMVQAIAVLIAVVAVVALVIVIAKRGVSIEIGG